MNSLTTQEEIFISAFEKLAGVGVLDVHLYLSGQLSWPEWWLQNFKSIKKPKEPCGCKLEALRIYGEKKNHGISAHRLKHIGFDFTLISGGENHYANAFYQCACGQKWKEVFIESGHYMANHAYPISSNGDLSWTG